jgi:hypothetical protein
VLSSSEIARGTQGSFKFLQRDPSALQYFENTFEACLRSFRVMALTAPIYALWLLLRYSFEVTAQAEELEIVFVEALHFVVDWLLFPAIFYEIARRRGWLDLYPRYIAALNWINLPAVALMLLGKLVVLLVPAIAEVIEFVLQALFFYWFLTVTRLTLQVNWLVAILLLIVNWVPSLFLLIVVDRFLGVMPLPA